MKFDVNCHFSKFGHGLFGIAMLIPHSTGFYVCPFHLTPSLSLKVSMEFHVLGTSPSKNPTGLKLLRGTQSMSMHLGTNKA